jgi:hypothetical protein
MTSNLVTVPRGAARGLRPGGSQVVRSARRTFGLVADRAIFPGRFIPALA